MWKVWTSKLFTVTIYWQYFQQIGNFYPLNQKIHWWWRNKSRSHLLETNFSISRGLPDPKTDCHPHPIKDQQHSVPDMHLCLRRIWVVWCGENVCPYKVENEMQLCHQVIEGWESGWWRGICILPTFAQVADYTRATTMRYRDELTYLVSSLLTKEGLKSQNEAYKFVLDESHFTVKMRVLTFSYCNVGWVFLKMGTPRVVGVVAVPAVHQKFQFYNYKEKLN